MKKTRVIELVATLAILVIGEVSGYFVKSPNHADLVQPGPAVEYTYPIKPPVGACPQNLLVSCNEHYESVPCEGDHNHGAPSYAQEEPYDGPGYHQPPPPPGYGVGPQYGEDEDGDYEDGEYAVNSERSRAMGGRNKWMKKYFKLKSKHGKHRGHRGHRWREGSELEDMSMEEEEM